MLVLLTKDIKIPSNIFYSLFCLLLILFKIMVNNLYIFIFGRNPELGFAPASSRAVAARRKPSDRNGSSRRYLERQRYTSASPPYGEEVRVAFVASSVRKRRTAASSPRMAAVWMSLPERVPDARQGSPQPVPAFHARWRFQ